MTCDVCKEEIPRREITFPDGTLGWSYSEKVTNTGFESVAHARCSTPYGILEAEEIE